VKRVLLALLLAVLATSAARATPPEPSGPHPRMLLDESLKATWKAHAKLSAGPVVGAIRLCDEGTSTQEHDRALYMGSEWSRLLQACLVAYAATDSPESAKGAIKFFTALIDDLDTVGDHRGGDEAARRDHGYPIRNLGPYTALAYDWLHEHPLMTADLKARARQRWKAWLAWYKTDGYRATEPGSNYHAGYLISATMIAIAEAGDAGADGTALWKHVADVMWGKEMANALSTDGILSGGNWPEGWQYGPLSVAEYSLAARVMKGAGVEITGISQWLSSLLRHHVYSLTPSDKVYPTGDNEAETPNLEPHVLTLSAIAFGDASPEEKAMARGELARLKLVDRDYFLYDALAAVGDKPVLPPRSQWPTWYLAANTGTLYARTRWDDQAIWLATECHATIETDHRQPSSSTFALSRGKDDVITDPSPYGSQSTLTGNAATVASAQLPKDYIPSQGSWSEKVDYDFITQRQSGIVAARCDYSDAFKFQHRPSDVPAATRDWVLVPSKDGTDAALVIIDRADTGGANRPMNLRFRTPGRLALSGETATATVGSSALTIASVARTSGNAKIGQNTGKDCYAEGIAKGRCDAARFPVTDYRVEIAGPHPSAVHVISATRTGGTPATAEAIKGSGYEGVKLTGLRDATIIWATGGDGAVSYTATPGTHVVLDATEGSQITGTKSGNGCAMSVSAGGGAMKPVVALVDADCKVTLDPEAAAASAIGTKAKGTSRKGGGARSPRSGCCGAEAAPGQSLAMVLVVGAILGRRRRRRATAARLADHRGV
jgi:hypothetical protein